MPYCKLNLGNMENLPGGEANLENRKSLPRCEPNLWDMEMMPRCEPNLGNRENTPRCEHIGNTASIPCCDTYSGRVQVLLLCSTPVSQDLEHSVQGDQDAQPPSTAELSTHVHRPAMHH